MPDYINTKINGLNYEYFTKNSNNNKKTDKIVSEFYDSMVEADEYVSKKKGGTCFNYTTTKIHLITQIPKPSIYDSHFFPKHIHQFIADNATYSLQFTCKIKNRLINVYFILTEEMKPDEIVVLHKHVHMMYMWLYILDEYSNRKCSKTVSVYVYLTPFEKQLPNNQLVVLNTEHVNTAYTTGCKESTEIVLYRSEEWFKVFIHETFHNFGLDFSDMNLHIVNKKLKEIFNVNIEFNLYESYCEFWARTINTMLYSYIPLYSTPSHTIKLTAFKNSFKLNMENECKHSLFQALKVLHFMDLNYNLIIDKTDNNIGICNYLYKEKTSVFSYYIITSLLMNNYTEFLIWCSKNNNLLIQFKKTPGNLESYIQFISDCCKNSYIKKNIAAIEKSFLKGGYTMSRTLRMTSNDIQRALTSTMTEIK